MPLFFLFDRGTVGTLRSLPALSLTLLLGLGPGEARATPIGSPPPTEAPPSGAWAGAGVGAGSNGTATTSVGPHGNAPAQVADSIRLHRAARDAQARFERIRVQHAPWSQWPSGGPCDEVVGRFCLRFPPEPRGGWSEDPTWRPPPDAPAVVVAREELLMELARVGLDQPGNAWVAGQRVRYLGEAGRWEEALEVAQECQVPRPGWCAGLEGLSLHHLGRTRDSEAAFDRALEELPPEDRERWLSLEWVVDRDAWGDLRGAEGTELQELETRIWILSDPLFLVEGNAFRTLHLARKMRGELNSEARNPHGLSWGRDMEEMLVRYGPEVSYERVRDRSYVPGPVPVVGRYDPFSRGIVPDASALRTPETAEPSAFTTVERRVRSRHAPVHAPTIYHLDPQVARFRRGDEMMVVAAWSLEPPLPAGPDSAEAEPRAEALEAGVFLLPVEEMDAQVLVAGNGAARNRDSGGIHGVASVRALPRGHVLSLEILDREGRRAWRHRRGITLPVLPRGVVGLSDVLLLDASGKPDPGATQPEFLAPDTSDPATVSEPGEAGRLEDHLDRALPGNALTPGPVEVAWEVYGLPPELDRLPFRVTVEEDDRGLLRRAGEALRLLSPPPPVEIRWEEGRLLPAGDSTGRSGGGVRPEDALFRRVLLDLSGLAPGRYRLTLRLALPGRTDVASTRILEIEG
jgi:hypothetical protein